VSATRRAHRAAPSAQLTTSGLSMYATALRTCASGGKGFSIANNDCSFHVDPSKTSLYANYSGKVSALVNGFPIHDDHYIHHHYQLRPTGW
jgi:hypothetical protein